MVLYTLEVLDDENYFEPRRSWMTLKAAVEYAMLLEKAGDYCRVVKQEVLWEDGLWVDTEDNIS